MTTRIAINGFGRMGRLGLRAVWENLDLEVVHINEIGGDAATAAHLLEFDSVHGTWPHEVTAGPDWLAVDGRRIGYSSNAPLEATDWGVLDVQIAVECTGQFKFHRNSLNFNELEVRMVSREVEFGA